MLTRQCSNTPFSLQPDIVKLQTVNLAAKLCIANARQSKPLCQYVLNLAKYDQNYDIRDRARFLRQLVLPVEVVIIIMYCTDVPPVYMYMYSIWYA